MSDPDRLEALYIQARDAMAGGEHEQAARFLKQIVSADEGYRDASCLLAAVVARRRRRWYGDPRFWAGAGILLATASTMIFMNWGTGRGAPGQRETPDPQGSLQPLLFDTASPPADLPASTPGPSPTAVPLVWSRLYYGDAFSRDRVKALAINPIDPDVLYAGLENAGIYKSIDGGISWAPFHAGLASASIAALVIDPMEPDTLYASPVLAGMYKSGDGASSWSPAIQGIIYDRVAGLDGVIAPDPQDHRHLYYADLSRLYESRDAGGSWLGLPVAPCDAQPGESLIYVDLIVHPRNSQVLFAVDYKCTGGLYRSDDGGQTWFQAAVPGQIGAGLQVAIDAATGRRLYFLADALYSSSDGGVTWSKARQAGCSALAIDPLDADRGVCAQPDGMLAETIDGGLSWGNLGNPAAGIVSALTFIPGKADTLVAGGEGLAISMDRGLTWSPLTNGLGGTELALRIDPRNSNTLYAEEAGCRLLRSTDGGRSWEPISSEGCGLEFDADGTAWYRYSHGLVLVSRDEGASWENLAAPLEHPEGVTAHPQRPGTLILVSWNDNDHVALSLDGGESWEEGASLPWSANRTFVAPSDGDRLYAIGNAWWTARSADGGRSWRSCGQTDVAHAQTDSRLAIDPRDPDRLLLATRGGGVRVSLDACASWRGSNSGLGSLFVNTLAIDPRSPDTVYAGTDGGAFVSFDGGVTWGEINEGLLGATVVYSIVVDPESNVYAATPYGIFRLEGR